MPESFFLSDYICCLFNKKNNNDNGGNDKIITLCRLCLALNTTVIFKVFSC